ARGHERGRARRRAAAAARDPQVRALSRECVSELRFKKLRGDAVVPTRAYDGDAGLDLSACERVELGPGERALVGTGLAVAIPEGHAGQIGRASCRERG